MVVVAVVSCVRRYGIGDDDGQPEISPSSPPPPPPPPNGPKSIVRAMQTHTHTGVGDGRRWVGRIIGGEGENGFRRSAAEYNNIIYIK